MSDRAVDFYMDISEQLMRLVRRLDDGGSLDKSDACTVALAAGMVAGMAFKERENEERRVTVRNVVLDPEVVGEYLRTDEGERLVARALGRDGNT